MNIAVLCKDSLFSEADQLINNSSWKRHHVKTHYKSWVNMKENNYSAFVLYFDDWKPDYQNLALLLRESFPGAVVVVISDQIPGEVAKDLLSHEGIGVFHPKRDASSVVEGIDKLIQGIPVHFRKEERFRAYPYVDIVLSEDKKFKLRTSNLSFSGAEIAGNFPGVNEGMELDLIFHLQSSKTRNLRAAVRWLNRKSEKPGAEVTSFGVEFLVL